MRFECRHLAKTYSGQNGGVAALADITLGAEGHEFLGIVGPSGCGKTTLLKLIGGLLEPTSGEIVVDCRPRPGHPTSALVFQDHGLFPWMTVLANVAFGLEMQGTARAEARDRAAAFLDRVGLCSFLDSYPYQLSVGMQQRVGISRAFVTAPRLLLMDEPFASLDQQTRRMLQGELLRLWDEQRSLVVFVTHDIGEAVRLSDRIVVMTGRPGRVREEISVPLPRPRSPDRRDAPEIKDIKWHIWQLLEDDVRAELGVQA
jgi:NitT/TauT family transport system ATP-binding protein